MLWSPFEPRQHATRSEPAGSDDDDNVMYISVIEWKVRWRSGLWRLTHKVFTQDTWSLGENQAAQIIPRPRWHRPCASRWDTYWISVMQRVLIHTWSFVMCPSCHVQRLNVVARQHAKSFLMHNGLFKVHGWSGNARALSILPQCTRSVILWFILDTTLG